MSPGLFVIGQDSLRFFVIGRDSIGLLLSFGWSAVSSVSTVSSVNPATDVVPCGEVPAADVHLRYDVSRTSSFSLFASFYPTYCHRSFRILIRSWRDLYWILIIFSEGSCEALIGSLWHCYDILKGSRWDSCGIIVGSFWYCCDILKGSWWDFTWISSTNMTIVKEWMVCTVLIEIRRWRRGKRRRRGRRGREGVVNMSHVSKWFVKVEVASYFD